MGLGKSAFFGCSRKRYTYKCIRTLKRPITIIHVKLIHTPYNGIKTLKVYFICIYIIQDRGIKCTFLVCLYVICVLNFLRVCYFRFKSCSSTFSQYSTNYMTYIRTRVYGRTRFASPRHIL